MWYVIFKTGDIHRDTVSKIEFESPGEASGLAQMDAWYEPLRDTTAIGAYTAALTQISTEITRFVPVYSDQVYSLLISV
jgi:hypothetical protein